MFNIFKPLCNHEFKYYNRSTYVKGWVVLTKYHFICKKCEKTITITEEEIDSKVEYYKEQYARQKALGRDDEIKSTSFSLDRIDNIGICYGGRHVTLALKYYKQRGIDLWEINEFHTPNVIIGGTKIDSSKFSGRTKLE